MNTEKRAEVLKAIDANNYDRLREISGRGCVLSLIRDARAA